MQKKELGQQKDFHIGARFMQRTFVNQQRCIRKSHGGFVRWSVDTAEMRFVWRTSTTMFSCYSMRAKHQIERHEVEVEKKFSVSWMD